MTDTDPTVRTLLAVGLLGVPSMLYTLAGFELAVIVSLGLVLAALYLDSPLA